MRDELIAIATKIQQAHYPNSDVIFLAGSVIRGEGTATSDLDLIVVFQQLPAAYRESFQFEGWPVEAFVHDPETLRYFFFEADRPTGIPSLPAMVSEGIEIPQPSQLSRELKQLADDVLTAGPPVWDKDAIDRSRYTLTGLIDDIRAPRSRAELMASGIQLYDAVADHYLRSRNLWSAKGKTIPRRLQQVTPQFAAQFEESFSALFIHGDTDKLIGLVENMLKPCGGWLFEGYKLVAPGHWRIEK
ncbi:nucleotidyltransferase [Leptolyngbya sp. Heron Island J]|uniref:nucleotidyltransferase domain-containing protein n=1 Tax=Leptolyngbya sp. Heron Island J TaxID=1385935 RepID=UPI0003B97E72|nr:nucleotidyltransferase domain-containing protein [Leptolyngbya sp. Heron Island J]ESA37298.1 nucleotidyltransferase [Leptolyngbya sp. Heron Island J]